MRDDQRPSDGYVNDGQVFKRKYGPGPDQAIGRVGPDGVIYPIIIGPGSRNPVPIGRVDGNGEFHRTFIGVRQAKT